MTRLLNISSIPNILRASVLAASVLVAFCCVAVFATFGLNAQTSAQEGPAQSAAARPSPDTQALTQALTLRVNGAYIPIQTVLAFSDDKRDKQALKLHLSTHPRTCDDYKSPSRALASGEQTLTFTVAPTLQRDGFGAFGWQITSLHHDAMSDRALGAVTPRATDAAQHLRFAVDVQMQQPASDLLQRGPMTLTLQGDVIARYCGAR